MRLRVPHIVAIALLAVLAALCAVSGTGEAKHYILTDSFEAPDGSAPDVNKWEVEANGLTTEVFIEDGMLRTRMTGWDMARARMVRAFPTDNVSLEVEFCVERDGWRPFEMVYWTSDGASFPYYRITVYYDDDGWCYLASNLGFNRLYESHIRNVRVGDWYVAGLNVSEGILDFFVWERDTGDPVWNFTDLQLSASEGRNHFSIGVRSLDKERYPSTLWDNFTLFDPVADPNRAPRWVSLPAYFQAVEDVPFHHAFGPHIDDDQPLTQVKLSSDSEYVTGIVGQRVSLLFPNNLTRTDVVLVADDCYASTPVLLQFRVRPVNDPPEHSIPLTMSAYEGLRTTIDLAPYVWDVDNDKDDLFIVTWPGLFTADGLRVTFTFEEGVTDHVFEFAISDGEAQVNASIRFLVTPIDNAPRVSQVGTIDAVEDEERTLDLAPFVSDPDTPVDRLSAKVYSENCTARGLRLTFLYSDGGVVEVVVFHVTDGVNWVESNLTVRVSPVDDPPRIEEMPAIHMTEGEAHTVHMGFYVWDEETPQDQLALVCAHPNVVDIDGLDLTMLYPEWQESQLVHFNVSDGGQVSRGHFIVAIREVNDPPRIARIGHLQAPYSVTVLEDTQASMEVHAEDPDDADLTYAVETPWRGLVVEGSLLTIHARVGDRGDHVGHVVAYDGRGGVARVTLTVRVLAADHRETGVEITSPRDGSSFTYGTNIGFAVQIHDPFGYIGGPVNTTWWSDRMGHLHTREGEPGCVVHLNNLSAGSHVITVVVTDGVLSFEDSVMVSIIDDEDVSGGTSYTVLYSIILMVVVVIILVTVMMVTSHRESVFASSDERRRIRRMAERDWEARGAEGPGDEVPRRESSASEEGGSPRRDRPPVDREQLEFQKALRELEGRRGRAQRAGPPRAVTTDQRADPRVRVPPPPPLGASLPSEEDLLAHMDALTAAVEARPGGLPDELSLFDAATIAKRIAKGRKMWTPDHRLAAFIQGGWYYADPRDPQFLERFEER